MADNPLLRGRYRRSAVATSTLDEKAIIRAAREMLANHGERAEDVAKARAERLENCGATNSATNWKSIAMHLRQLRARATAAVTSGGGDLARR